MSKKEFMEQTLESDTTTTIFFTEIELKRKYKDELIKIGQRFGVACSTRDTKDIIIRKIMEKQNNPLNQFNRGTLEYALPWIIITKILDYVWASSQVCTCYHSQAAIQQVEDIKNTPKLYDNPETWLYCQRETAKAHLDNPFCPFKSLKNVYLYRNSSDSLVEFKNVIFNRVQKLKLGTPLDTKPFSKLFGNIRSLTSGAKFIKPNISPFKNLVSINFINGYEDVVEKSISTNVHISQSQPQSLPPLPFPLPPLLPTLPFHLIEKIIKYSWNGYYCTCHFDKPCDPRESSLSFLCSEYKNVKSKCLVHRDVVPDLQGQSNQPSHIARINQLRFSLTMICKRLFSFISKQLFTSVGWCIWTRYWATFTDRHYSNPFCLFVSRVYSLESLTCLDISMTVVWTG
ncbi:hypothetical protein DFA_06894 [Cavenderia fasciculata]|uniref:Uncharacterized protein n=1 Tax=Cavenderia fasciculata TaxID=261658 RepID=F4PWY9_CACFS|nr:uncharacterized protein DFA_06894 [Cavenderia fasciculata]EGG19792.1 hypothetical protein DFA_06894 [Cavenderia fasciculata]|eukprot:XP_004358138.1 hypothetical protein DFA_06894 [Cavenderia fasciculata]